MKKTLNFFGSAQAFGFGGITELAALEGAFRLDPRGKDAQIMLVRNNQFDAALRESRERFKFLPPLKPNEPYLEALFRIKPDDFDAVVSSYDTASVFYGWYKDIPVYFYDGMMWFWDFDKHIAEIPDKLQQLRRIKLEHDETEMVRLYEDLVKGDYHSTVLIAYYLANKVYVRNGQGVVDRIGRLSQLSSKTKIVGAMIDPTHIDGNDCEKEHILVSLSGSLAPTVKFEDNLIFARGALKFAIEAKSEVGWDVPWIFCCHPKIYEILSSEGRLENLPQNFTVRTSMSYGENLEMIKSAHAFFASPGFSSVQEAGAFRTPLFFLPEQNGGQPKGFSTLKDCGYPTQHNLTVTDHINSGAVNIGEYNTDELYEGVSRLWSDEMQEVRLSVLRRFREVLVDKDSKEDFVQKQKSAIEKLLGGFDGATSTVKDILDNLNSTNE